MAKNYDIANGIKFAFKNFREGDLLKWSAFYFFGLVGALVADFIILGIILFSFMYMVDAGGVDFSDFSSGNGGMILVILAMLYLMPRLMASAMRVNSIKLRQKMPSIVEWFIFITRKSIVDMLCWYDRKLLAPAALFFALGAFCMLYVVSGVMAAQGNNIAGNELAVIGGMAFFVLGLLAWLIGAIVHSTRTYFGYYMLLRGDAPEQEALKKSFDVVKGQTFEVFLAGILFAIVVLLLWLVAAVIMFFIAIIPCIGAIIDLVLALALLLATIAINEAYFANVFKFYCPQAGSKR